MRRDLFTDLGVLFFEDDGKLVISFFRNDQFFDITIPTEKAEFIYENGIGLKFDEMEFDNCDQFLDMMNEKMRSE